jgi:predicted small metal-binding protein
MVHCTHPGCGWQAIAPSQPAAQKQYAEHLVAAHATETDADIPDGKVEVRVDEDDEWRTMTFEQAKAFHEGLHRLDD